MDSSTTKFGLAAGLLVIAVSCGSADADVTPLFEPPPAGSWSSDGGCDVAHGERLAEAERRGGEFDEGRTAEDLRAEREAWTQALRDLEALSLVDAGEISTWRMLSEDITDSALSLWGDDGRSLHARAESEGVDVRDLVFEVLPSEWAGWTPGALDNLADVVVESYRAVCIRPPSGWEPLVSDPGLSLPRGSLTFSDLEAGTRRAWRLPDLSESAVPLEGAGEEMGSPDGRRIASRLDGGELWIRPADGSSAPIQVLAGEELGCAVWSHDSAALLVSRSSATATELIRFDVATAVITVLQPERDIREVGECAIQVDERELVVTSARDDGVFEIWLTALDGRRLQLLVTTDSCTVFPFSPARPGPAVTLAARCRDPYQSGLWELDLADETLDHLATGIAGAHSWSADGRWVAFAGSPAPMRWQEVSVWITDTTTGGSRQLTDAATSWPLLLTDSRAGAVG